MDGLYNRWVDRQIVEEMDGRMWNVRMMDGWTEKGMEEIVIQTSCSN